MTVGVDDELRIREYAGDDSANPRAVPFRFLDNDALRVTRTTADGSETVLVRGTHYSVAGAGDPAGGSVTPLAPIATGTSWRIEGDMSLGQPTDYTAGDDFPAESHERGLDRSMIAHQEARRDINDTQARSLMVPRGELASTIPAAAVRAGKFQGYDAMGVPVALQGTGNDPAFRGDVADPAIGGRLMGHRSRLALALNREIDGKAAERVSWLDLLPYAKHAPILEKTGHPDCAAQLNAQLLSLPPGVEIFCPGKIYLEEPLIIPVGCSLVGERGRRDSDNSWDNGGGSEIVVEFDAGDAMVFTQAALGNNRMAVALENLLIRGARVRRAGTAASGRGLVFNAPNEPATAIHLSCRNVNVVECMEAGWWIEGPLYDALIEYCGAHDNGKNGRRIIAGGADAIGETTFVNFRSFANGALGAGHEQDGCWDAPGHTLVDVMLSASENFGNQVTKQAGLHTIIVLQTESCPNGKSCLYVGSAGGGAGTGFCSVKGWLSQPGANFTGQHLWSTSDAINTRVEGVHFGDSLNTGGGGRHFITQGPSFSIKGIRNDTGSPLTYLNQSRDAWIEDTARVGLNLARTRVVAVLDTTLTNQTGNGATPVLIYNQENIDALAEYNPATGVFTARSDKDVRLRATALMGSIVADHDRSAMFITCSDAAQSVSVRQGSPFANADGLATHEMAIEATFRLTEGATLQVQPQITGAGAANASIVGSGTLTRLEIVEF